MRACPECGLPVDQNCFHDNREVQPVEMDKATCIRILEGYIGALRMELRGREAVLDGLRADGDGD